MAKFPFYNEGEEPEKEDEGQIGFYEKEDDDPQLSFFQKEEFSDLSTRLRKQLNAYYRNPDWQRHSARTKEARNWRCEYCGSREGLQVHHLRYDRVVWTHPGLEPDMDLIVLCRIHHLKAHGLLP